VVLPAAETEFDGQSEQAAGPKPSLYWLTPHRVQLDVFAPVYPALHAHAKTDSLPAGESIFSGHVSQKVSDVLLPLVSVLYKEDAAIAKSLSDRW